MAASFNLRMTQVSYAQEVNRDLVCQRFPLNFRCIGYTPKPQQEKSSREKQQKPLFEREANQFVKVRLELSGPDNEWIWIETNNNGTGANILTAYHTKRVRRELLSNLSTIALRVGAEQLASEVFDGYDGPVPIPNVSFYRWADHETRQLVFVPDGCSENSPALPGNEQQSGQSGCVITGTTSITLPSGTDIRSGLFTIEYTEEDLMRTITFRVPSENL